MATIDRNQPTNKNDPTRKRDQAFENELNTDKLDSHQADFDDFDFDFDGFDDDKDRNTASSKGGSKVPWKSVGKGVTRGVVSGLTAALANALPKTAEAITAAQEFGSELSDLKDDVFNKVDPLVKQTKQIGSKLLPRAKQLLPENLYSKIEKTLHVDPDSPKYDPEKEAASRRESATADAIKNIFKSDVELKMHEQRQAAINRIVDQKIEAVYQKQLTTELDAIRRQTYFQTNFLRSTYVAYLQKDLQLKYQMLYTQQDILAVSKLGYQSIGVELEKIRHNTALPDVLKKKPMEALREATLGKLYSGMSSKLIGFGSKMVKNFADRAINPALDMASTLLGFGDMWADMQSMDDTPNSEKISQFVTSFLTSTALKGVSKKAKDKKSIRHLERYAENMQMSLPMLIDHLRRNPDDVPEDLKVFLGGKTGEGNALFKLLSFVSEFSDDIKTRNVVQTAKMQDPDAPGSITNKFTNTVETIIPNYLRLQVKYLEALATHRSPDEVDEVMWDPTKGKMNRTATVRSNIFKERDRGAVYSLTQLSSDVQKSDRFRELQNKQAGASVFSSKGDTEKEALLSLSQVMSNASISEEYSNMHFSGETLAWLNEIANSPNGDPQFTDRRAKRWYNALFKKNVANKKLAAQGMLELIPDSDARSIMTSAMLKAVRNNGTFTRRLAQMESSANLSQIDSFQDGSFFSGDMNSSGRLKISDDFLSGRAGSVNVSDFARNSSVWLDESQKKIFEANYIQDKTTGEWRPRTEEEKRQYRLSERAKAFAKKLRDPVSSEGIRGGLNKIADTLTGGYWTKATDKISTFWDTATSKIADMADDAAGSVLNTLNQTPDPGMQSIFRAIWESWNFQKDYTQVKFRDSAHCKLLVLMFGKMAVVPVVTAPVDKKISPEEIEAIKSILAANPDLEEEIRKYDDKADKALTKLLGTAGTSASESQTGTGPQAGPNPPFPPSMPPSPPGGGGLPPTPHLPGGGGDQLPSGFTETIRNNLPISDATVDKLVGVQDKVEASFNDAKKKTLDFIKTKVPPELQERAIAEFENLQQHKEELVEIYKKGGVKGVVNALEPSVRDAVNQSVGWAKDKYQQLRDKAAPHLQQAQGKAKGFFDKSKRWASESFDTMSSAASAIGDRVVDTLTKVTSGNQLVDISTKQLEVQMQILGLLQAGVPVGTGDGLGDVSVAPSGTITPAAHKRGFWDRLGSGITGTASWAYNKGRWAARSGLHTAAEAVTGSAARAWNRTKQLGGLGLGALRHLKPDFDKLGSAISSAKQWSRKGLGLAGSALAGTFVPMGGAILGAAGMASRGLKNLGGFLFGNQENPFIDVFVKDEEGKFDPKTPRLQGVKIKEGVNDPNNATYFTDDGKVLQSAYEIKGPIYSKDGLTTYISKEELKRLCDAKGDKLKGRSGIGKIYDALTGGAKSLVGATLKRIAKAGGGVAKLGLKTLSSTFGGVWNLLTGGLGAIGGKEGLFGKLFGSKSKDVIVNRKTLQEVVGDKLEDIYILLYERMAKPSSIAGDTDSDGIRDGSYAEFKKRRDARDAERRKRKEEGRASKTAKGKIKDSAKGLLASLAGLIPGGSSLMEAGSQIANMATMLKGTKVGRMVGGAAGALGRGVSGIGGTALRGAGALASAALPAVASAATSALGAVGTGLAAIGPVGWAILGTAAVGSAAYWLFSDSDNEDVVPNTKAVKAKLEKLGLKYLDVLNEDIYVDFGFDTQKQWLADAYTVDGFKFLSPLTVCKSMELSNRLKDKQALKDLKRVVYDSAKLRPVTWCELFYIAAYVALANRHAVITRHPVLVLENIVPDKIHVTSTTVARKVTMHNLTDNPELKLELPEYPILGKQVKESLSVHPSHLDKYDGRTTIAVVKLRN